jgi:hypothetical protein
MRIISDADRRLLERHFPSLRKGPKERGEAGVFEIGLVLAGAVSAGAYTAGVVDFLIEALDQWHLRKAEDVRLGRVGTPAQSVPHHKVILRIVTGTSAGGMNGAIAAAALPYRFPHVAHPDKPQSGGEALAGDRSRNPFFSAWVERVDIAPLLDTGDIGGGMPVSLLNCRRLDEIADDLVAFTGEAPPPGLRDWLAQPYEVRLTSTNLRGVPFAFDLRADAPGAHQGYLLHADQIAFAAEAPSAAAAEGARPDCIALRSMEPRDSGNWQTLRLAALATGAFPVALEARDIVRDARHYLWRASYFDVGTGAHLFANPAWPGGEQPARFGYAAVDGGVMNNEPFDIARQALAGARGHNPQSGGEADRAVILIDPFVEEPVPGPAAEAGILDVIAALIPTLTTQAQLSAQDLLQIEAGGIYSRFMVSPARKNKAGDRLFGKSALATGELHAFFGFFSRAHREHDYFLGRRNAQRFLQAVFTLPAGNSLFADGRWTDANRAAFKDVTTAADDEDLHLQIIPLCGSAAPEEPAPAWPTGAYRPREDEIARLLRRRIYALGGKLPGQVRRSVAAGFKNRVLGYLAGACAGAWLWLGWRFARGAVAGRLTAAIAQAAARLDALA